MHWNVEYGMWISTFHIPHSIFHIPMWPKCNVEYGMWPNSKFPFQNLEIWNLNCLLRDISPSASHHTKVHWNVEHGMWNSTFQFPFQNLGIWNLEFSSWECLTPHHARVVFTT